MDELEKLVTELSMRYDDLEGKEKKIREELVELNQKDDSNKTEAELARVEEIRAVLSDIEIMYDCEECRMLQESCKAKSDIEYIIEEDLNKSVRTKKIKSLMEHLTAIKDLDDTVDFTYAEIQALYDSRANETIFNPILSKIDTTLTSNMYALIDDLNEALDDLNVEIENLYKPVNERTNPSDDNSNNNGGKDDDKNQKRIVRGVILGVVGIAALAIILHSCNKNKAKPAEEVRQIDEPKQTEFVITTPSVTAAPVVTAKPTAEPTAEPTAVPTAEPTPVPTAEPTAVPTAEPTPVPTAEPTVVPTAEPTPVPTAEPTPVVLDRETDIQNRAIIVANTNFFEGAYPSDVVGVLNAIHDKEMWATENAEYAQAFNTTFNRIFDHYMTGTLTMDDINKLDALKDLAKDNSDLDRFLEMYAELLKGVLTNQKGANTRMRQFIEIFGTSLNGFTNEPNLLTNDDVVNEAAQVNDFFDWWFAYDSIIKPTYPLLYPARLYEIDGAIIENIMYYTYGATEEGRRAYIEALGLGEYEEEIYNLIRLLEMQMTMESALTNHPKFCEIRHITEGPELVRGGND